MQKDLATPILALSAQDQLDAGAYLSHIFGCGQTGSGKTSGLLSLVVRGAMKMGAGSLFCLFKAGAAQEVIGWAKESGCANSVIHWHGRNHRFNFLHYFVLRYGVEATGSIVQCLMICLDIIRSSTPNPGKVGDEFWQATTWNKLANSVPVLFAATGNVRIADLLSFIRGAPQAAEQVNDPAWRAKSYFFQAFGAAQGNLDDATFQRCLDYWQNDYFQLDQRTRANIHISVVTALAKLNQGILRDVLCTDSTLVPELCMNGATILMDFPPSIHGDDGIILQKIVKYCWQEAMLLRPALDARLQRRICLLVADECQEFVTPRDTFFLAVCRSARVGVLYLTQSLPTLMSRIGGEHPQERAHDLLSHFNTKVFLANSCPITNKFASDIIGRTEVWRGSINEGEGSSTNFSNGMGTGSNWGASAGVGGGSSHSNNGGWSTNSSWNAGTSSGESDQRNRSRGSGTSYNQGWSSSQTMDVAVEPGFFARSLKTGGHANGGVISALWFRSGWRFAASGTNRVIVEFRQ